MPKKHMTCKNKSNDTHRETNDVERRIGKMNEKIFRKKSLDKVKSPENLDEYIKASNPNVWLLLISVIVLLAGACVWGFFGRIDSTVPVTVNAKNGICICYVTDENISAVRENMIVRFNDFETVITEIGQKEEAGYPCILKSETAVADGFYDGKIVIESIKPISFILN